MCVWWWSLLVETTLGEPLPHSESASAPQVSSSTLGELPKSHVYGIGNFRASLLAIHSLVCWRHFLFSLTVANEALETEQNKLRRRTLHTRRQCTALPLPKTPTLMASTTTPELAQNIARV